MTRLVAIEGCDGVGKGTVAALLPAMLAPLTSRVFAHEHPGPCTPWAAATCYASQRAEVASRMALGMEPDVVIADRWWMTGAVFAMVRCETAAIALAELERVSLPPPALVVLLDASDATLDARRPTASAVEREAREWYRSSSMRAAWGAVAVSAEGDARAVAWRVARLVMDVMAHDAPGG
jgi:thymidylate kinase